MESGRTLSHYGLIEKIGEGGMGVVWKAEDKVLNRTVAIKVLPADVARDEERRRLFLAEAKLASSLSHAHIAQVYELGREGDLDFIVMEYIEGKPLDKILHGPMPADKVANLGLQVSLAVSRAHHKGLLHRDIKPANIMVTSEGDAKVVDFGLATLFERRDTTLVSQLLGRTQSMPTSESPAGREIQERPIIAGTVPYMSPEQVRGEGLDGRSDVFSFGTVLYEMTTGERPFKGATTSEVVRDLLRCLPPAPHEIATKIPLDLERIIQKAMAPRPADRYQTMDDLAVDLKRLGRELDSGSSPSFEDLEGSRKHGPGRSTARLRMVGFLTLAMIATIGLAWAGYRLVAKRVPPAVPSILVLPLDVRGSESETN